MLYFALKITIILFPICVRGTKTSYCTNVLITIKYWLYNGCPKTNVEKSAKV